MESLASVIREKESDVEPYLRERKIRTLADSAIELLETGQTSLEEVITLLH